MFKRILIPTDGSPIAIKAARAGIKLAKALGARVVSCHIVEELDPVFRVQAMVSQRIIDEIKAAKHVNGKRYVDAVGKIAARSGVAFTPVVSLGRRPHEGILNVAKTHKCDGIFIATHGRGGFNRLMMGNVAQKVMLHASVPVLVYR